MLQQHTRISNSISAVDKHGNESAKSQETTAVLR